MQKTSSFQVVYKTCGLLALLLLSAIPASGDGADPALDQFARSSLHIESGTGRHAFNVYLAVTRPQQTRGLMYVRELPANEGMLFVYGRERIVSMWMKNTYIPLDMLFIDAEGRVSGIIANTTPFSEQSILSQVPVKAVLELNSGIARKLGIRPGDRVIHELLEPRPGS